MLPKQEPQSDWEAEQRPTPGPLTSVCRVTIWRHREVKSEYLALAFACGARVVIDKKKAGHLLQVLTAWLCPGVQWPPGAYPGKTAIVLFDGDLPKEANDDIPF